jgi:HTH-type transcriptional regulator, competence development regulator
METIGQIIRTNREKRGLLLRVLAAQLDIDSAILSKIERSERKPTRDQILKIADIFKINKDELLIQYLSEKIAYQIVHEDVASKALKVAERKVKYLKSTRHGKI